MSTYFKTVPHVTLFGFIDLSICPFIFLTFSTVYGMYIYIDICVYVYWNVQKKYTVHTIFPVSTYTWYRAITVEWWSRWNGGTSKSSILIRFSLVNHPFWVSPLTETSPDSTEVSLQLPPAAAVPRSFSGRAVNGEQNRPRRWSSSLIPEMTHLCQETPEFSNLFWE